MEIQKILNEIYGSEVYITKAEFKNDSLLGSFISSGRCFDIKIQPSNTSYKESRSDTKKLRDYILGNINVKALWENTPPESFSINFDSFINDNDVDIVDYLFGYIGLRNDSNPNCKEGIPCGGTCLPRGAKCNLGRRVSHAYVNTRLAQSATNKKLADEFQQHMEKNPQDMHKFYKEKVSLLRLYQNDPKYKNLTSAQQEVVNTIEASRHMMRDYKTSKKVSKNAVSAHERNSKRMEKLMNKANKEASSKTK